jgi:hypothetical protein
MARMTSPAPPAYSTAVARPGLSRARLVAILLVIAVIGYAIWQFPTWLRMAEVGSAYGARMGCSCRYVQGRDIQSCATDAEPGMEIVSLTDLPEGKAVRASVPLLASREARYEGATGCVLVPND